jgi:hypothetical protein
MTSQSAVATGVGRISFNWIIDKKNDLRWYIGSALGGWLYAAIILLAVSVLKDPAHDAFTVLRVGGFEIPITLELLVYSSWAFLIDAPHIWSTLARTFFDPEERRQRRRELWLSWGWFFFGPTLVLAPHFLNWALRPTGIQLSTSLMPLGAIFFVVFFRLWAYYHVVRQHWGFFMLYKRKNNDMDPREIKIDKWFFYLSLYLPLLMFLSSDFLTDMPEIPDLGFSRAYIGGVQLTSVIYNLTWLIFLSVMIFYIGFQIRLWMQGRTINGPKLLFMAGIVPLHVLTFNTFWLAILLVPVVTVGHNIQYHRIVWEYGQNKYERGEGAQRFTAARFIFSKFWIYFGMGILFTLALYRGPWIDWIQAVLGVELNKSVLAGVGMMSGMKNPGELTLTTQLFASFMLGWAFQHYYLDSKIWRVSKDKGVAKQLKVE